MCSLLLSGCFAQNGQNRKVDLKGFSGGRTSLARVYTFSLVDGDFIIQGKELSGVSSIRLVQDASSGTDTSLTIKSRTDSKIIAEASSLLNLNLTLSDIFSLVISDAYGASTFPVNFVVQDGSITAAKLATMGASDGDVLVYNQGLGAWETRSLGGNKLVGTWNANTNSPNLADGGANTAPVNGDYYIVSTAGTVSLDGISTWSPGDWVIFDQTSVTWKRVANSSDVTSFNGRQGAISPLPNDYLWSQIDKTVSPIGDLSNVDTSGAISGSVLKFDGVNWIVGTDTTGLSSGAVDSTIILDGSIADADVAPAANIAQSKISNLTTDLAARLRVDGTTAMTGALDMGAQNITNVGTVDGVDVSAMNAQVATNVTAITSNTSAISSNATAISGKEGSITAGAATDYYRGDKTWQTLDKAAVGLSNVDNVQQLPLANRDNGALSTSTVNVPTSNAVKSYVDSAVSGFGSGDFKKDGTVAMTGSLDFGNNKALFKSNNTNYVELMAPNSLAATYTLTLPPNDGDASQILQTNGAGVLSWVAPTAGTGDITAVTAGTGLTGGATTGAATLNVDVGTTASKIVQLDGSGYLPAVDGRNLTNLPNPTTSTVLSGFTVGADATVANTDTVEVAIEKLQGQVNGNNTDIATNVTALSSKVNTSTTVNGNALSSNITLDTGDISENGNLYFTPARAIASALTGYSSGAGTVAAADSIVTAIGKLNGNIAANSSSISGLTSSQWTTNGSNISYSAGNVGIGTTAPARLFTIDGQGASSRTLLQNTNSGSSIADGFEMALDTSGNSDLWLYESGYMRFATANTERMRIDNAGNVGIGTTIPEAKLNVNGSIRVGMDAGNRLDLSSSGHISHHWTTDAANVNRYFLSSNVGNSFGIAGTDSGGLQVSTSGGNTATLYRTAGGFNIRTGSTDHLNILDSGNVGVGTTTPGSKLDVQGGNINTSGSVSSQGLYNYGTLYMPYRYTASQTQQSAPVSWSDTVTFTDSSAGAAQTVATSTSNYFVYQRITQVYVSCYFVGNSIYNSLYRLDFHNLYQFASVSVISASSSLLSVDSITFGVTGSYNSRQLTITVDANSSYAPNNHQCYVEAKPF